MNVRTLHADCIRTTRLMAALGIHVDSVVTDPPYHLQSIVKRFGGKNAAPVKDRDGVYLRASAGFMGQQWDGGDIAFDPETWRLVYDVMRPGAHLVAFGGTRGHHRMICAIEDAGLEIRDCLMWLYGSGFPKSHNLHDDWEGWGTALKPAWEPICLARKPLSKGSVAANVLAHGTGALNIDACRVGDEVREYKGGMGRFNAAAQEYGYRTFVNGVPSQSDETFTAKGRWPANVVHDGSDEVVGMFPREAGAFAPVRGTEPSGPAKNVYGEYGRTGTHHHGDSGSAARFFYAAKAGPDDRHGSKHPTIKPVSLMRWLVRMVTPPGGLVLDPFAGSGTTGIAAIREGVRAVLIEREAEYHADILRRLAALDGSDTPLFTGAA